MQVLHIASEMTPVAKVGGLGDVLMGLTRELSWKGHETLAILPNYGVIDRHWLTPTGKVDVFDTWFDGMTHRATVTYYTLYNDITVGLLDTEWGFWRQRQKIYGNWDEVASFLFFARSVADWLVQTKRRPNVLHVHDWQAALVPLFCRALDRSKELSTMKSVLTVHNFEYQGCCHWGDISRIGLFPLNFADPSVLQDPWNPCLNPIKAGLLSADFATTVSPTYSQEVRSSEGGRGLHHVLSSLGERFSGVLNGLDYAYWNPEIDPFLFERYSTSLGSTRIIQAKQYNKKQLFAQLGIPLEEDKPLVAAVTRLVPQKGIYLIQNAFFRAESLGMQCILLGSVADAGTEPLFRALDTELRRKGNGAVLLMSDEMMAHRLYAAADLFVVPSLFEPCGLTQLIALKYGAIPVVRKTGGLADTVIDVDSGSTRLPNGFSFEQPDQAGFDSALLRALILYSRNKEKWTDLMMRGMKQDFSWHQPGSKYLELYQKLLKVVG